MGSQTIVSSHTVAGVFSALYAEPARRQVPPSVVDALAALAQARQPRAASVRTRGQSVGQTMAGA